MKFIHAIPVVIAFGGTPDPPKQSENSKKLEALQIANLQAQLKNANKKQPEFKAPDAIKYAPPPSSTSSDAEAQARELRFAALKRRGLMRSVKAGSTGGFVGGKTTLG